MTERENEARTHVRWDNYTKAYRLKPVYWAIWYMNHIVPVAIRYQSELVENVKGLKELFGEKEFKELAGARLELIRTISQHVSYIKAKDQ